uniref:quinone oxidoreductase family protein n=1 Tax=Nonomuraea pusilla TaxID=46177 RepID=UPI0006E20FBB|nr:zinc-binding dehydrogenase [Nonomuraea pusilla]
MRAIVMHRTGGPETLGVEDVPRPTAGAGQVVVKVLAIAASYAETRVRAGVLPFPLSLPVVPGAEVAGEVVEIGEGADPGLLGRLVVGVTGGVGAYAEYAAMPAAMACPVPEGVRPEEAVAAAAPAALAHALLHRARLRPGHPGGESTPPPAGGEPGPGETAGESGRTAGEPLPGGAGGETVLVEAGGGSVGGYLVLHAKEFGAGTVVATAGAEPKRRRAAELGADLVLDHRDPGWPEALPPVDVVFDSIGGATAARVLESVTPGTGRILSYGLLSGEPAAVTGADLVRTGVTLAGCGGPAWAAEVFGTHYPAALVRLGEGRTRAFVEDALPLEQAAEAHRRLESRTPLGRLLLIP